MTVGNELLTRVMTVLTRSSSNTINKPVKTDK